jgi:hypothetical protein
VNESYATSVEYTSGYQSHAGNITITLVASPTSAPSGQPTRQPSSKPSNQPSRQPSSHPTCPSSQPTRRPSSQPTSRPSEQPIPAPTNRPSCSPSSQPTQLPSAQPICKPSTQPSSGPTRQPTSRPSLTPSSQPSSWPSVLPTSRPSDQPSSQPSGTPSALPSAHPSSEPTVQPTSQPSSHPSKQPSSFPSGQPSSEPTVQPSADPTTLPTGLPTNQPSGVPTDQPSAFPTGQPTSLPSNQPTGLPTSQPTDRPSPQPSSLPSALPSVQPSNQPSPSPSSQPSILPTGIPSSQPSTVPSVQPTSFPTNQPSGMPTDQPSSFPSSQPTEQPTVQPSVFPSSQPSGFPSSQPTRIPSSQPTSQPTGRPSEQPTVVPSKQPSVFPTTQPSDRPTNQPTGFPSSLPSTEPTSQPSLVPSSQPATVPSTQPSRCPSSQPTANPSCQPSGAPTSQPTVIPSSQPSDQPSVQPSSSPTEQPSSQPTSLPSLQPSAFPSTQPGSAPTARPSGQPTLIPTSQPFAYPSSAPVATIYQTNGVLFYLGDSSDLKSNSNNAFLGSSFILFGRNFKHQKKFPFTIPLRSSPSREFTSKINSEEAGIRNDITTRSTTIIGDINGDSFLDLMIGYPLASKCSIYLGNGVDDFATIIATFGESFEITGNPEQGGEFLGWSSIRIGDLNGDGFDELVVSAINMNTVFVIYGRTTFNNPVNTNKLTEHDGFQIIGSQEESNFGVSIALLHRFHKGSAADIAITAERALGGQNVVYVLFGLVLFKNPQKMIKIEEIMNNPTACLRIIAPVYSYAGFSIAGIGDINSDGFDDLAIGSVPYTGRSREQKTFVVFGRDPGPNSNFYLSDLTENDGFIIIGGGFMVAGVGDLNGDGIADMMISDLTDWKTHSSAYLITSPSNMTYSPSLQPSSSPTIAVATSFPSVRMTVDNNTFSPTKKPTFRPSYLPPSRIPTIGPTRLVISQGTARPSNGKDTATPTITPTFGYHRLRGFPSTHSPTVSPTINCTIYTEITCPSQGQYQGMNHTHYLFRITANTGIVKIIGNDDGEAKNLYVLYCPKNAVDVVISNFRVSTDLISVVHLSEEGNSYSSINDLTYSSKTGPLTLLFCSENKLQVILSSHTNFDLQGNNFLFLQTEANYQQEKTHTVLAKVQIGVVVSVFVLLFIIYFALSNEKQKEELEKLRHEEELLKSLSIPPEGLCLPQLPFLLPVENPESEIHALEDFIVHNQPVPTTEDRNGSLSRENNSASSRSTTESHAEMSSLQFSSSENDSNNSVKSTSPLVAAVDPSRGLITQTQKNSEKSSSPMGVSAPPSSASSSSSSCYFSDNNSISLSRQPSLKTNSLVEITQNTAGTGSKINIDPLIPSNRPDAKADSIDDPTEADVVSINSDGWLDILALSDNDEV